MMSIGLGGTCPPNSLLLKFIEKLQSPGPATQFVNGSGVCISGCEKRIRLSMRNAAVAQEPIADA